MLLLLAAFNDAFGVIVNKVALSKAKVPVPLFTAVQFFFLTNFAALSLPFLGQIAAAAFNSKFIILFVVMLGLALSWNLLYYQAIQQETVETLELYLLLLPLLTVIISAIFFQNERHLQTLVAALVASVTLVVSHLKRRTIKFDRSEIALLLGVLLMAVESVVIKLLVEVWSPAALYTARTLGIFLVMAAAVRPTIRNLSLPAIALIILSALAGVIYKIIQFTGYAQFGIVFTTLVLILSPAFVLFLGRIVLKEKIHLKQVIAMVVIIAAVVWGTFAR